MTASGLAERLMECPPDYTVTISLPNSSEWDFGDVSRVKVNHAEKEIVLTVDESAAALRHGA